MKYTKTRKYRRNTNMYGGQGGPPSAYSPTATEAVVLDKLAKLGNEASILFNWSENYNSITQTLNNPDTMKLHLEIATNINNKAEEVYATAKQLWRSVYGSEWVPPPEPAPAPRPAAA